MYRYSIEYPGSGSVFLLSSGSLIAAGTRAKDLDRSAALG